MTLKYVRTIIQSTYFREWGGKMENYVITITREYGSGGRIIAKKLAEKLNIKFYDKDLIAMTAKETGFAESFIEQSQNSKNNSFLYNLCVNSSTLPVNDQVFLAHSETIKKVSAESSCVIVGRCADYVLRDSKNCLSIFIHAPFQERVERAKNEYGLDHKNAETIVIKTDKERSSYYNYYTPNKWGKAQNYHLCVNSTIGIDESVELIVKLIEEKYGGKI